MALRSSPCPVPPASRGADGDGAGRGPTGKPPRRGRGLAHPMRLADVAKDVHGGPLGWPPYMDPPCRAPNGRRAGPVAPTPHGQPEQDSRPSMTWIHAEGGGPTNVRAPRQTRVHRSRLMCVGSASTLGPPRGSVGRARVAPVSDTPTGQVSDHVLVADCGAEWNRARILSRRSVVTGPPPAQLRPPAPPPPDQGPRQDYTAPPRRPRA
jgi:hypothetical protein